MGNLTRMPDLRYLPSGMAVCEFGIAVSRKFTTGNQQDTVKEDVCFVDIVVWGKIAETSGKYLEKGAPVFIEGRLQLDQWKDRETGSNRSRLRVVAERVQFLNRSDKGAAHEESYEQSADGYEAGTSHQSAPAYQQAPTYQQPGNFNPPRQAQNVPRNQPQRQPPRQQPPMPAERSNVPPMPDNSFNVGDAADDDIPF